MLVGEWCRCVEELGRELLKREGFGGIIWAFRFGVGVFFVFFGYMS